MATIASIPVVQKESNMSMSNCLDESSPEEALFKLSCSCKEEALRLSNELSSTLSNEEELGWHSKIPKFIVSEMKKKGRSIRGEEASNLSTSFACAESIVSSLSKIAAGGSRASEEMKAVERQRMDVNNEIIDLEDALRLRQLAAVGAEALGNKRYAKASAAVKEYHLMSPSEESLELAGSSTVRQLKRTEKVVQDSVLALYEDAVKESNLAKLSSLTPLLGMLQLADKGVGLYLRYIQKLILEDLKSVDELSEEELVAESSSCKLLAKIFNVGVMVLRHHLPMVASALGDADGDAALVQLVHLEIEKRAVKVINVYSTTKQFSSLGAGAESVISHIEDKYVHGNGLEEQLPMFDLENEAANTDPDDCGFQTALGSLTSLDSSLGEAALLLQHTESYERFVRHAVSEVTKARGLRKLKHQRQLSSHRREKEEETQPNQSPDDVTTNIEILPRTTILNDVVAEFGGHYSGLEHALLLGSVQRAFLNAYNVRDVDTIFCTVSINIEQNDDSKALQTSLVEECFYAAQRSTVRAFATGHSGTACAAANFCADAIGRVLFEGLIRKANAATTALKALLIGPNSYGQAAMAVIGVKQSTEKEKASSQQQQLKLYQGISRACAFYNDLEVAMEYTKRLEAQFFQEIQTSYPEDCTMTEQLRTCIKLLTPVMEHFKNAAIRNMEQNLGPQILPKVRNLTNESVGLDASTSGATSFMSTSAPVAQVKMNYNLDEEAFELAQVTEGYMSRLCSSLDQLIQPLKLYLMPRLSDALMTEVISAVAKRLESAIRRVQFSVLGAISLDSDIRYFTNYAKQCFASSDFTSNFALYKASTPVARLSQIALLMNVDDLEDVLDLIASSKRKGNWDLKLDDAKAFLNLRVDFEGRKVNELLRISEEE